MVRLEKRVALVALVLAGLLCPPTLLAQEQTEESVVEGYVVKLLDDDIVVDLAGKQGAENGDVVELWRPLKLKHPVTGKVVVDRFLIGTLRLTQVREALAIARPKGKLRRPPEPGDVVILRKAKPEAEPAPAPATKRAPGAPAPVPRTRPQPPRPTAERQDPDAVAAMKLFEWLYGQDIVTRIRYYERFARDNPHNRYARVFREEARQLRWLLLRQRQGRSRRGQRPMLESFSPPAEAVAGTPLRFGVELAGPLTGAVLHSRHAGEVAYTSVPMTPAGPGYFVAVVEADRVRAPKLEYFIEATTASGEALVVVADAAEPNSVYVYERPEPARPSRHEVAVGVLTDYADWNRLRGNDVVWQTEGDAGMRFGDKGMRAVRTGFGVYRGVGGTLRDLDERDYSARKVGLTYGFLEGEFGISHFVSFLTRGVIGLLDDGVSGGAQALIRIGNDQETNLLLGGEVLGGVGLRGITQLELATFEKVPIMVRTEVTDQPAGSAVGYEEVRPHEPGATAAETSRGEGEVGARAIVQVGYRFIPGLEVAVRGSYQGRTIYHAGPGVGGAVRYQW